MKIQRVYFISDGTGITAERVGQSLLTQFKNIQFIYKRFPYVRDDKQAQKAIASLQKPLEVNELVPIVFCTFVNPELTEQISSASACVIDLFSYPAQKLKEHLGVSPEQAFGLTQGMGDKKIYDKHMDAINFSVDHDDAHRVDGYDKADIILLGLSRSGKTPTCMYLSIHYFVKAANYPITEDELDKPVLSLPEELSDYRDRLLGLIIEPDRLCELRQLRLPDSDYASLEKCKFEVSQLEQLYKNEGITSIDTTESSIPEISIKIMNEMGLYD